MIGTSLTATRTLLLTVVCSCAFAQDFVTTPPPQSAPPTYGPGSSGEGLYVTPRHGQTQEQQWTDRYACHGWAKGQTGYDPIHPGATGGDDARRAQYRQAMMACLEGRGYSVSTAPPPGATPAPAQPPTYRAYPYAYPPYAPPEYVRHYASPEVAYHPFRFSGDFGFTAPTGATSDYLDWGANIGLAVTWFPSSTVPVGLRVDPSYSWFHVHPYYNSSYDGYQDVYGTDLDLQVNLGRYFLGSQFYLFGGPGWYKIHSDLHQIAFVGPPYCDPFFFYCTPGYPISTGELHNTSSWRNSWNIGLGWETALDSHTSVFVEARYQSIDSFSGGHLDLVPVRFGIRF